MVTLVECKRPDLQMVPSTEAETRLSAVNLPWARAVVGRLRKVRRAGRPGRLRLQRRLTGMEASRIEGNHDN
jgi:hypothetical protein